MSLLIKFLNFTVNTQQQSLLEGDQRIEISSTAYQLLSCFLQQPNKTLSRQQLTSYVWPDRVVAETSLDKLIQRLRKILGDTGQHKEIIKTIHGVGFVFLPAVNVTEEPQQQVNKSQYFKWMTFILLLSLVCVAAWFLWTNSVTENHQIEQLKTQQKEPLQTVALVPDTRGLADQDQAWMLRGGMHYLKEQFNNSLNLEIKNINLKSISTEDPERYAIALTIENQVDAVILVQIIEEGNLFQAHVQIRNSDGILAEQPMTSASIKTLYDQIGQWSQEALAIQSLTPSDVDPMMSQDSYAVENYIRGMSAQASGYAAQAIKYFELATKEDPEFWLAWYELSLAHRKQGNYNKALSIISVFENVPLTDKNNLMIINAKALNLYFLGDYAQGIDAINSGISISRKANNQKELRIFLTNKALFAKAMDDLVLAKSSIQESIAITEALPGNQAGNLGSAYNTLAGIEINLNELEAAQDHANKAISYFNQAGNKRSQATAQSRLSSIKYTLGDWASGEALIKQVLAIQQELEDIMGQTTSYMRLTDYAILKGDFTAAQSHQNNLASLMRGVSNKYQNDDFLISQIKVKLITGDLQSAQNLLDELNASEITNEQLYKYYLLSMQLFSTQNNQPAWQKTADEFIQDKTFSDQPHYYLTKAFLAMNKGELTAAQDAFEEAKKTAIASRSVMTIADVMNPYILFLTDNDSPAAYTQLLEAEKYPVPPYPFLKTKSKVLVQQKQHFKAIALMEELKIIAGDHWAIDDQLYLESLRKEILNNEQ